MHFFVNPSSIVQNIDSSIAPVIIFIAFFILIFIFRDSLSQLKERIKSTTRKWLYETLLKSNTEGSTINIQTTGFIGSMVDLVDKFFLTPSEGGEDGTYDYFNVEEEGVTDKDEYEDYDADDNDDGDDEEDEEGDEEEDEEGDEENDNNNDD